ncbi:MAG: hypothetical protein AAFY48_07865 [Bacteroidota bacterium]
MKETRKWWLRKVILLLFLVSQFYLAKKYGEPYPCIILPSFAQAYPVTELSAATTYAFILDKGGVVDTLEMGELFPFVPPNYHAFTAERLLRLSPREVQAWQQLLEQQLPSDTATVLRIEQWTSRWETGRHKTELIRSRVAIREIQISDGLSH